MLSKKDINLNHKNTSNMKINYYKEMQKIIEKEVKPFIINNNSNKPTLLLHTCCAICASSALLQLYEYFNITILYSNANIQPINEYQLRLKAIETLVNKFNQEYQTNIKIIVDNDVNKKPYEFKSFYQQLKPYANSQEQGERCLICYKLRLARLMYFSDNNYNYCTTTLTLGRYKNAQVINQIAKDLLINFPNIKYLYSDFKKNDGIKLSNDLSNKYELYRQHYCGCAYSIKKD